VRIAVDARPLAAPLSGIGRYTRTLLDYLVLQDHEWFLYSDRPLQQEPPHRVQVREGSAPGGSPRSLCWTQWQYTRWAARDGIDLFWSPRHHLPLLLGKRVARVVTIHDLVWRQFPETMKRSNLLLERMLMGPSIRMADRVICVSDFTAGEVARYYPSAADRCQVVHEAALDEVSTGLAPEGVPGEYLLFVGTLEPRKNLPRLLRSYSRLGADTVPLVIAGGSGWGGEDLQGMLRELGLESRVHLCGYVADAELQALYAGALCLLMPSLYEGFGLPVLEAMKHGVPVIAANAGALPEIAGDAALLVDPVSEADIADAIRRLQREPGLVDELSRRSFERAAQFSWQRAANETLALFEAARAIRNPDLVMEDPSD
jgi:glycosyltransferase involved in cell wall biosynthesis